MMRALRSAVVVAVLAMPAWASAQIVSGSAFRLTTGPCITRSGTGSPEGVRTGVPCDMWMQTDSPYDLWRKYSGTGNTGWIKVTNGSATWGTGTVTSVGLSVPSLLSVSGSPVTSNGTLAVAWNATSGTVPYFSGASTLAAGSALTFDGDTLGVAGDIDAYVLNVQSLVSSDVMATIGGRVVVAPTTYLTAALASGGTTMTTMHNNLANGDRVVMEAGGQLEWIAIASAAGGSAGAYTYTVTRNLDGSGANDWVAGDGVMNTGTTGDGYIDLASDQGLIPGSTVGPTIAFNVRTGTTWNNIAPRAAIGNLNGLYGYATDIYGAAFGDNSTAWLKVDATNGVRLGYNTTTNVQINASGVATFSGALTTGNGTTYSTDAAVNFSRPSGRQYGGTGDISAMWYYAVGGYQDIRLDNIVTGGADYPADARVSMWAQGWNDGGAGSAEVGAGVQARSDINISRVTLSAGSETAYWEGGDFFANVPDADNDLGTTTYPWRAVYVTNVGGGSNYVTNAYITTISNTNITTTGTVRANTAFNINGTAGMTRDCNGTSPGGITFVGGIMTNCTAVEPLDPSAPTLASLQREIEQLRSELAILWRGVTREAKR